MGERPYRGQWRHRRQPDQVQRCGRACQVDDDEGLSHPGCFGEHPGGDLGRQVVEGQLQTGGGFDAILREATFDTGGMVIDVARIDVEPDGSGPAAPGRALLRVTMAGQQQQIIEGYWLCTV